MNHEKVFNHFMEQLTFHTVEYAGESKENDWHIVEMAGEILVLIDQDGDIISYTNDVYLDRLKCKYTRDYVLIAGELYKNRKYTGSKLKKVKISNHKVSDYIEEEIKDMILHEGGLVELLLEDESVFIYNKKLVKKGITTFSIPRHSVEVVYWQNNIMRLKTNTETYYMPKGKNRVYSEKSIRGKKLSKIFSFKC